MGSFFTSVQIHVRGRESLAAPAVVECLRRTLQEDGFLPAEPDETPERTILLASGMEWISVYDGLCDDQRQDALERLGSALSRDLDTHAVTVLVHDSDVLELQLFAAGARLDRFNSHPDYFGKVSSAERRSARGKPEEWSAVLAPGTSAKALRAIWRKQKLFADDTLRATADLLGLQGDRACVGFRYAQEGDVELAAGQLLTLAFRRAIRPAQETRADGPPRFQFQSSSARVIGAVGSPMQFAGSVGSVGGSSRALLVVVGGDALERGVLSVTSAQLVISLGEKETVLSAAFESDVNGESMARVASFPDVVIAAGPAAQTSGTVNPLDLEATDQQKLVELAESWKRTQRSTMNIHVNVFGTGVAPGAGAVQVGFVPLAAPDGHCGITMSAEVFAPARKPLRASESAPAGPQLPTHVLLALVSLDLERGVAAAACAPMIERFCTLFEPSGELSLVVFPSEPGARLRQSKAKVSGLCRGARWQKLKGDLERERCVGGERKVAVQDFFARRPSDGFSFGGALIQHDLAGDPELPTLALWFDLENVSVDRAFAAESLANELMAEAMTRHSGVQALVGRTTAVHIGSLDTTEYESTCGVHGPCTLRRSWLSRFLRSVMVGTLWLGKSLTESIPDLAALRAVARAELIAGSLKVTIDNDAAFGSVEHAVAPLLPSADDARRATDRLYGR